MRPKDSSLTWRRGDLDFLREIFFAIDSGGVLAGDEVKVVWASNPAAVTVMSTASEGAVWSSRSTFRSLGILLFVVR